MLDTTTFAAAALGLEVSKNIQSMLTGLGPDVQGSALADLVAIFIAGHAPEIREDVINEWMKCVRELIPHCHVNEYWKTQQ